MIAQVSFWGSLGANSAGGQLANGSNSSRRVCFTPGIGFKLAPIGEKKLTTN